MSNAAAIRIRFCGVRGSHPPPQPSTVKVGGNSSCAEITTLHTLVFAAGTGLIELGREPLERAEPTAVQIFIGHTHHDHIEGLRFFEPAYRPEWQCHAYRPEWAEDSRIHVSGEPSAAGNPHKGMPAPGLTGAGADRLTGRLWRSHAA